MTRTYGLPKWKAAYLAACIDTDGYVTLLVRKRKEVLIGWGIKVEVGVTNTDLGFLEYVREVAGSGRVGLRTYAGTTSFGNEKPCYALRFPASWLRDCLPSLLPFLRVKRRKAEILLSYLRDVETFGKGKGQSKTVEEYEKLVSHRNQILSLSQKGKHHRYEDVPMRMRVKGQGQ